MAEQSISIKYRNFEDYLAKHQIKNTGNGATTNTKVITNTRIGDKESNIYPGKFHVPDDEYLTTFLHLYYRDVIAKNKKEYLTEKQLEDGGVILIDVDFRHDYDIDERQYTKDHVEDLLEIYLEELKHIYQFDDSIKFFIFVFEKPDVNRLSDKKITKDGIHIMICLNADHIVQRMLRDRILPKVAEAWSDLPVTNSWSDVFDAGISAGHTNWQLYGSRKPNHVSYKLKYVYEVSYDPSDGEFMRPEVTDFDVAKNISLLSVRYKDHASPFMKTAFIREYDEYKRVHRLGAGTGASSYQSGGGNGNTLVNSTVATLQAEMVSLDIACLSQIRSQEELDAILNNWLDNIHMNDYILRDMYDYVMILPIQYYGEQSYDKWIRVGWALRNVSNKLLIVWIKFSSRSPTFQFTQVQDLCDKWRSFDQRGKKEGLTNRSIMYWAKQDAKAAYDIVRKKTIDYYIENTINILPPSAKNDDKSGCGHTDLAEVLYQKFKDKFVCTSTKGNIWFQYIGHRWKRNESGTSLRKAISEELRDMYNQKSIDLMLAATNETNSAEQLNSFDQEESSEKKPRDSRAKRILSIVQRLSNTSEKNNIMTEAKEKFYDPELMNKMDTNPYLLCFDNGVFDFKEKVFRDGRPEDNISMCTNINYIQLDPFVHQPVMDEINAFMNQLFPEPELCEYMWNHLASTLIGTVVNQTFNMYVGIGRNGKSVLIQLMTAILGDYQGDVPLSLVTGERTKIGGAAPELVMLKGTRYAVMVEPKKGDKMNEGVMKQLTGKDPVTARGLYVEEPVTYVPQFKLVVGCNNMLEVNSMDHGTWRRIRAVPFKSLFTENPVSGDPNKPYQFKIDPFLEEKFPAWKEVFMAMLVKRACETNGVVKDCKIVTERSDQYRNEQDAISNFARERIVKDRSGKIKKSELNHDFKHWYANNGDGRQPLLRDLYEYMNNNYGKPDGTTWKGISFVVDRPDEDDNGIEDSDINQASYGDMDD
jgi:P4 family phage/plasmid primase-like protien